jgi:hypothetical protein
MKLLVITGGGMISAYAGRCQPKSGKAISYQFNNNVRHE